MHPTRHVVVAIGIRHGDVCDELADGRRLRHLHAAIETQRVYADHGRVVVDVDDAHVDSRLRRHRVVAAVARRHRQAVPRGRLVVERSQQTDHAGRRVDRERVRERTRHVRRERVTHLAVRADVCVGRVNRYHHVPWRRVLADARLVVRPVEHGNVVVGVDDDDVDYDAPGQRRFPAVVRRQHQRERVDGLTVQRPAQHQPRFARRAVVVQLEGPVSAQPKPLDRERADVAVGDARQDQRRADGRRLRHRHADARLIERRRVVVDVDQRHRDAHHREVGGAAPRRRHAQFQRADGGAAADRFAVQRRRGAQRPAFADAERVAMRARQQLQRGAAVEASVGADVADRRAGGKLL